MRSATTLISLAGLAYAVVQRHEQIPPMPQDTGVFGAGEGDEMPMAVLKNILAPEPTPGPKPRLAAARNLFARINADNTCGYVHYFDDPESDVYPITCAEGYLCTNIDKVRDCCRSGHCSTASFYTACLDSNECPSDGPDAGTFCCTFSTRYPFCASYLWSSSTDTQDIYTFLNCRVDTEERIGTIEADSIDVSDNVSPSTTIDTTASGEGSSETVPFNDEDDGDTGMGDENDDNDDLEDGGSNTGAIVGGVVGGVSAIAIIAFAVFWFIKKKKSNKAIENSGLQSTYPEMSPAFTNAAAVGNNTPSPGPDMTHSPVPNISPSKQQYTVQQSMYGAPSPQPSQSNQTSSGYPSPMGSPQPYGFSHSGLYGHVSPNSNTPVGGSNPNMYENVYTNSSEQGRMSTMSQATGQSGTMGFETRMEAPGGGGTMQNSGQSNSSGYQPGGQASWYQSSQSQTHIVEAPADNAIGTNENRAELG